MKIPKFSLFEQRRFSDPSMMQMSNFVLRYLCGQASKATHDISLVGFCHPFTEHELESDSEDASMKLSALKTCQNLLRGYGSYQSNSPSLSVNKEALWEMIHQHQEWIYTKARELTLHLSCCGLVRFEDPITTNLLLRLTLLLHGSYYLRRKLSPSTFS